MKKFFRTHSEAILISLAALFLLVLVGFFYETIQIVFFDINQAIVVAPNKASTGFDLQDAAKIDFRGLVIGTSSTPAAPGGFQATFPQQPSQTQQPFIPAGFQTSTTVTSSTATIPGTVTKP